MFDIMLEASSLTNPLAEAWRRCFELSGYSVLGVVIGDLEDPAAVPSGWTHESNLDRTARCGTLVTWWGLASIAQSQLQDRADRIVAIVDTYPNASRPASELREWIRYIPHSRKPDALVCYSDEMIKLLRRRNLTPKSCELHVLLQPFALSTHRDSTSPSESGVVFTGRADYLFSEETSMKKDSLGGFLQSLIAADIPVTIQRPISEADHARLRRRGFSFYERMSNEDVLDGHLAEMIAQYGAQLAHYNIANRTVDRRVRGGLSSRFALGATANCRILVPRAATGPLRWVTDRNLGDAADTPMEVKRQLARLDLSTDEWRRCHHQWSVEGQRDAIHRIVDGT